MNYNVSWSYKADLDKQIIINLERKWHVNLPQKYVDIVLHHDGSVPYIMNDHGEWDTSVITVPGKLTWSIQLLPLIENEVLGRMISPIELVYDALSEALPLDFVCESFEVFLSLIRPIK